MRPHINSYQFSWFDWFCLIYPPGWLILFNRHWQHYHVDRDGWNWLEYGLFLLPGGFYLALLLRWLRLGCRSPQWEERQFDPSYQQAFRDEILAPILKYYFRGSLQQIENLPQNGPLIVAMNHAGMCFPWDFLGLACLLGQNRSWMVRPLAGISLFEHPWVKWWLPPGWSQVLGGVKAELNDFKTVLGDCIVLLYAPEGLRGPQKGWKRRYQLERFHPSFIQLSDRYRIPILPVVCLGNESLHPWSLNLKRWARRLKLPFLPISILMFAFILFPSMGVWASRSRLSYYIQPLYQPWSEVFQSKTPKDFQSSSEQQRESELKQLNRSSAYLQAQQLRVKLQNQIDYLLKN
ncbi:1-acyl-sn-glycerol-3-phosphate acyltransferase [Pleurocapsales cyanobacterium LEGE 06147]|nr:1-acyl-sn-glycerol-3-phosphate acyltransferase [Pleurocapsales cyanobacterium LEGE 06147]